MWNNHEIITPLFSYVLFRMIFIIFTFTANTARNQSERGKADSPEIPDCNTGEEDLLEARNFFPPFSSLGSKIATGTEPIRKIPRDWNYFTSFLYMYLLFVSCRIGPHHRLAHCNRWKVSFLLKSESLLIFGFGFGFTLKV